MADYYIIRIFLMEMLIFHSFDYKVANHLHDFLPYLGRLNVIVLRDVYFNFHNSNVLKVNTKFVPCRGVEPLLEPFTDLVAGNNTAFILLFVVCHSIC
jgi:hypothetical protein